MPLKFIQFVKPRKREKSCSGGSILMIESSAPSFLLFGIYVVDFSIQENSISRSELCKCFDLLASYLQFAEIALDCLIYF